MSINKKALGDLIVQIHENGTVEWNVVPRVAGGPEKLRGLLAQSCHDIQNSLKSVRSPG